MCLGRFRVGLVMNVDPGCFVKEDVLYLSKVEFFFLNLKKTILCKGVYQVRKVEIRYRM